MIFNPKNFMLMKALFGGNSGSSGDPGEVLDGLEIVPDFSAGDYEVVAPTGLLVRSAIIKKPKTLVPDNIAEGVEIAGVVGTHVGGGSSGDNRVKYVTFMYGETELIKYPVISGDTCRDPVANGYISEPTKESTAQYNYTYAGGWSAWDGGSADANILKNITEDKTVYAAFKATARLYTITWLDEDGTELPGQKQWAYGTVPSYTPTKEGAAFDKWTPTPTAVTGNATYTASWSSVVKSGSCGTNVYWSLSTAGELAIYGTGTSMTTYKYPESRPWDEYSNDIKSLVITAPITSIRNVCSRCKNLTSVILPDSLLEIGDSCFYGCSSLRSIDIPDRVSYIKQYAFQSSGLVNVTIPAGVKEIEQFAFSGCALTSVFIPAKTTLIGPYTFGSNNALESVVFENTEGWFVATVAPATSGTNVDVSDPATNATMLKTTYLTQYWKRA